MVSIAQLEKETTASQVKKMPNVGDKVRVHVSISEGKRTRIQKFEGLVIACHKGAIRSTFTVRKESLGVGVERIFPIYSPLVKKVDILARHKVRRAKLYYMRALRGKKARLKEIRGFKKKK
jgi:large subunit ribosomal protein L19